MKWPINVSGQVASGPTAFQFPGISVARMMYAGNTIVDVICCVIIR